MNNLIKLLSIVFLSCVFNINTYWYTIIDCSDFWERICPTYIIWKVLNEPKKTTIKEIWDNKQSTVNEIDQITFAMGSNRFFMFDYKIKEYIFDDIILNRIQLHSASRSYIPKQWDILLYERNGSLNITSKYFKEYFWDNLNVEESYVKNGQNILWKHEYESVINWYTWAFILNDYLQNYNIIYCENDTIKIKPHKNNTYNTYLPFKVWQLSTIGTWDDSNWKTFPRDMFTMPKVSTFEYSEKNLKEDLQYLAPCDNFNIIFKIDKKTALDSNSTKNISEKYTSKKEKVETNYWKRIVKVSNIITLFWIPSIIILYLLFKFYRSKI